MVSIVGIYLIVIQWGCSVLSLLLFIRFCFVLFCLQFVQCFVLYCHHDTSRIYLILLICLVVAMLFISTDLHLSSICELLSCFLYCVFSIPILSFCNFVQTYIRFLLFIFHFSSVLLVLSTSLSLCCSLNKSH